MATTDFEEEEPTRAQQLAGIFGQTVATVTDTDATIPLRVWLLLMVIAFCMGFAPDPARLVGVLATLALALSSVRRNRR